MVINDFLSEPRHSKRRRSATRRNRNSIALVRDYSSELGSDKTVASVGKGSLNQVIADNDAVKFCPAAFNGLRCY